MRCNSVLHHIDIHPGHHFTSQVGSIPAISDILAFKNLLSPPVEDLEIEFRNGTKHPRFENIIMAIPVWGKSIRQIRRTIFTLLFNNIYMEGSLATIAIGRSNAIAALLVDRNTIAACTIYFIRDAIEIWCDNENAV